MVNKVTVIHSCGSLNLQNKCQETENVVLCNSKEGRKFAISAFVNAFGCDPSVQSKYFYTFIERGDHNSLINVTNKYINNKQKR